MRNTFIRFAATLGFGLFLAGAACATPPQPILWKVSKGESTVYLLGSMHFLMDSDYPLSADVDAAYKDAEKLVFEVSPAEMNPIAMAAEVLKHGVYMAPGHQLQDDLSAPTWRAVVDYGAKNNLPVAKLQKFQPWMMFMTLVALESQKMGLKPDIGLDMHFMQMASADHKPTGGLETVDQQLAIFYDAPIAIQEKMLKQSLDEVPNFKKEMEKEHDTWRRGDANAMLAGEQKDDAKIPGMHERILVRRNRNWSPQIEKMLDAGSDDTLVIVGALHLPGPDGVVRLLQKEGYAVERFCTGCTNVDGKPPAARKR